jgi:Domain of unknown function (DUF6378)
MKRDEALDKVKQLTMHDRNQTHGDPILQFEKAQRIKDAVGHHSNPNLSPAEIEAIEMICTKLSRWTSGPAGHLDHALDIIGYASIAVEAISSGRDAPKENPPPDAIADLQRIASRVSPFAGPGQVVRPAPNPRKVEMGTPPAGEGAA